MVELGNLFRFVACYTLCLIYSSWIAFGILIAYILKRDTKFWVVKERLTPPRALTSNEFGDHKFARVNVSAKKYFLNACGAKTCFISRASRFITLKKVTQRSL